ncbi:MAG TPA: hypothetical protein VFD58_27530 [Blastocatellia bacterium]|nr:hypothetical protein [Blastocatellia bacterium]
MRDIAEVPGYTTSCVGDLETGRARGTPARITACEDAVKACGKANK